MGFFEQLFGTQAQEKVDFSTLLDNGALVLDVRTVREFHTGHIKNSLNIPVTNIQSRLADIKAQNKVVIAVCASGIRSANAAKQMQAIGIEAYNGGSWMNINNLIQAM